MERHAGRSDACVPSSNSSANKAIFNSNLTYAYKCVFCEALMNNTQSFAIHLKSSHPAEDVSFLEVDDFASRRMLVESEKVVNVTYAFAAKYRVFLPSDISNLPPLWMPLSPSSAVPTSSSSSPKSGCVNTMNTQRSEDLARSSQCVEDGDNGVLSGNHKTKLPSKETSVVFKAEEPDSPGSLECDRSESRGTTAGSESFHEASVHVDLTPPTVMDSSLLDVSSPSLRNARRRPTDYEKIAALTCAKCGRKFRNRCSLTFHQIEHKRSSNPYKCLASGCLESYVDRKKLITHLSSKHDELCCELKRDILAKGDCDLAKRISVNEPTSVNVSSSEFSVSPPSATVLALHADNQVRFGEYENCAKRLKDSERARCLRELRANKLSRTAAPVDDLERLPSPSNDSGRNVAAAQRSLNTAPIRSVASETLVYPNDRQSPNEYLQQLIANIADAGAIGNISDAGAIGNIADAGAIGNIAGAGAIANIADAGAIGNIAGAGATDFVPIQFGCVKSEEEDCT